MLPRVLESDFFVKLPLDITYLQLLILLPGVSGKRTNSVATNTLKNGKLILYLNNITTQRGRSLEYSPLYSLRGYPCLKKEKKSKGLEVHLNLPKTPPVTLVMFVSLLMFFVISSNFLRTLGQNTV